jgi:hypothetical protein
MRRSTHVIPLALAILLAGCATQLGGSPNDAPTPDASRPTRSAPELATVPASDAPVTGEVPSEIVDRVVADAAERTGAAVEAIDVVAAMAMTWSDGSLGCPEPGMFYTQALVDGYHVVLDADGEELDYRITRDGGFRLCENGGPPSGG